MARKILGIEWESRVTKAIIKLSHQAHLDKKPVPQEAFELLRASIDGDKKKAERLLKALQEKGLLTS